MDATQSKTGPRAEYIKGSTDSLFKYWLIRAMGWGIVLFLGLSALDYVSTPENFSLFLRFRIIMAGILVAISFLLWRYREKGIAFHLFLGYAGVIGSAVTIEMMILRFGGASSPYYVGMILLVVAVVGFLPGKFVFYVTSSALIYFIYVAPILLSGQTVDVRYFFLSNAFMSFIIATMLFVKYLNEKRLVHELGLMYDLEEHRKNLEGLVEQRTSDLSEALERVQSEVEERKRIDAELSVLNEQLRQSQKMEAVGLLAGGIAHDFSNILTSIKGCGYILSRKLEGEQVLRRYAEQIVSSSNRANSLTQSLLAFSRRQVLAPRPVDINETIRKMSTLLTALVREDVELTINLSRGSLIVRADEGQLEQVALNLAANARDAMPAGGTLSVRTGTAEIDDDFMRKHGYGKKGHYAVIVFSDTGTGMDRDTEKRIFEPFFTTKEFGKGSGLGLAIVYGIVKQHTGYIDVESEPGRGSTFRVYIPLFNAVVPQLQDKTVNPPPGGTETILLMEDDADVRKITAELFQESGYTVLETADGEEGLGMFLQNSREIDLVLLDVIMPKKKGVEVAEEIRRACPGKKILFMSGYVADLLDPEKLKEGMQFISKTVSPDDLLRKVREMLDEG